jgi:hypothetical protein
LGDKRKKTQKQKPVVKRETRRRKRLADEGRLVNGVEIPRGAVLADPARQVPWGSYSPPPTYYVDKMFTCVDCGREEVWTGKQQKWYYEVAKGSLHATAIRCQACRRKRARRREAGGDPHPIKHAGTLMKRIRRELEPSLLELGFSFEGRRYSSGRENAWLDYSRPGLILRCSFVPREARLIAETMDENAECDVIADVELSSLRAIESLPELVDSSLQR